MNAASQVPGPPVTCDVARGIATLCLDRPERLNAFDEAMLRALAQALQAASASDATRVVVLKGSGRAFSAGQNLRQRADAFARGETPDLRRSLDEFYNPVIRLIAALPVPIIAEVGGVAFGAGAAMALACDIVIAAQSAKFQFGFRSVALGPDCGSSYYLARHCGLPVAMDLLLTGRAVSAREALDLGLVSRVVPDETLAAETGRIAQSLAEAPAETVRAIRNLVRQGAVSSLDEALDAERDSQARLGQLPAYREKVVQFAERRRRPSDQPE